VLPTKTSTFEVYDDPFARIVSPPQSPGDVQATSPLVSVLDTRIMGPFSILM